MFLNKFRLWLQNLKKKFKEFEKQNKSKKKSFIIGFKIGIIIFRFILFAQKLSTVLKQIPNINSKTIVFVPPSIPPK